MQYRQLGCSGIRVSQVCLGAMSFSEASEADSIEAVNVAFELGINFFDTADCYGARASERVLGKAIAQSGKREQAILATKCTFHMGKDPNDCGASRRHIIASVERSLQAMQTDYIDLFVLHVVDINTSLEEQLRTLDTLVKQGKIRYIGTSKHPAALIVEGLGISRYEHLERFVSEQCVYNLLDRRAENDLIWTALRHHIAITPFSPLGGGILTGKYNKDGARGSGRYGRAVPGEDPRLTFEAIEAAEKLGVLAEAKGVTAAQLALAWLMQQPGVTSVLQGGGKAQYVRDAVAACDITITDEDRTAIDAIVPPGGNVSDFYGSEIYNSPRLRYALAARRAKVSGSIIPDFRTIPWDSNDPPI